MAEAIIDRGRGPEIAGTRISVYSIMDFVRAGFPPEGIASAFDLSLDQCGMRCITSMRTERTSKPSMRRSWPDLERIRTGLRPGRRSRWKS